MTGFLIKSSF